MIDRGAPTLDGTRTPGRSKSHQLGLTLRLLVLALAMSFVMSAIVLWILRQREAAHALQA